MPILKIHFTRSSSSASSVYFIFHCFRSFCSFLVDFHCFPHCCQCLPSLVYIWTGIVTVRWSLQSVHWRNEWHRTTIYNYALPTNNLSTADKFSLCATLFPSRSRLVGFEWFSTVVVTTNSKSILVVNWNLTQKGQFSRNWCCFKDRRGLITRISTHTDTHSRNCTELGNRDLISLPISDVIYDRDKHRAKSHDTF